MNVNQIREQLSHFTLVRDPDTLLKAIDLPPSRGWVPGWMVIYRSGKTREETVLSLHAALSHWLENLPEDLDIDWGTLASYVTEEPHKGQHDGGLKVRVFNKPTP